MVAQLLAFYLIGVPTVALNSTPGPSPEVTLFIEGEAQNIVHFRLYEVPDPESYLLESYRQGYMPKNAVGLKNNGVSSTYAAIKRETRTFRYWLREVMSYPYRSAMVQALDLKSMEVKTYDTNKKLPPLNGFRLIKEWDLPTPIVSYSDDITIPGMDTLPERLYLLETSYSGVTTYIPVLKTTLFSEFKVGRGRYLLFLTDSASNPIPGARVAVIENRKRAIKGVTNPDGIAEFSRGDSIRTLMAVFVTEDNRVSVCGDYSYGWFTSNEARMKAYVYTDRPIYKPGHTVYINGILRKQRGFGYRNAPNRYVILKVSRGWGETELLNDTLMTDEFGAFNDSLVLPDNAKLGSYYIEVEYDGEEIGYRSFEVQEYVKPEFKVSISTDGKKFVSGDEIHITVSAEYIFGAPLKGGVAELVVTKMLPWWYYYNGASDYQTIFRGSNELNDMGKTSFKLEVPLDSIPYNYRLVATVTGPDGRKISSSKWVQVYPSSYVPNIRLDKFIYTDDDTAFTARVTVHDIDGNPISTNVKLTLYRGWRRKEQLKETQFATDENGEAQITMPLPQWPDDYFVVVKVTDPRGRQMIASEWFYRANSRYRWWSWSGGLELKVDRDTVSNGDSITAVATAQIPNGKMLMTLVAGDTIIAYDVVDIKNHIATIKLPVPKGINGWVRLAVEIGGQKPDIASKSILVVDSSKMLNVRIETEGKEFEPGSEITLKVKITDFEGRPAKAEFSIAVVDEAIYQLKKDNSGDIFANFYMRYQDGWLWSFNSTYFTFYTDRSIDLTELAKRSESSAEAIAQFKEAAPSQTPVRAKFKDLAFWRANARTNGRGEAVIRFRLPDNITQWRVTVKAFTKDTRLGQATHKFYARKRVFVTVAPPRYLTVGDTIEIPTTIHNFMSAQMEFKVDVKTDGLKLLREGPISVRVPSQGSRVILWTAVAETPGSASVQATASTFRASDAVRISFPIKQYGLQMSVARNVEARDGVSSTSFVLPEVSEMKDASCRVTLASGYITVAMAALPYLRGYPYGCVEQTMSRFLPDIIVKNIASRYGIRVENEDELEKMINMGLKRLYSYQHYDGGWGWWQFDDSEDEMTGYVMWGLALARMNDIEVNPSVIASGLTYIKDRVGSDIDDGGLVDLLFAYSYYDTLTDEMIDNLRDVSFSNLTPVQEAKFAILTHKLGMDDLSKAALKALEEDRYQLWEYEWIPYDELSLAWRIMAYSQTGFRPVERMQAAADTLISMRKGPRWSSTLTTAYSVMALSDLSQKLNERAKKSAVTLKVNGHEIFKGEIGNGEVKSIDVPLGYLKGDTNTLTLKSKRVKSFASLTVSWFSGKYPIKARSAPELSIKKELYRLDYRKKGREWVAYETPIRSGSSIRPMSRIKVKLTIIANKDIGRIIVEDPVLPGAEIDENDLMRRYIYDYWDSPIVGMERKNDHIAFAIPYINEGDTITVEYVVMLQNKGVFHLMPAVAYGMYMPQSRANSREYLIKVH